MCLSYVVLMKFILRVLFILSNVSWRNYLLDLILCAPNVLTNVIDNTMVPIAE